MPRLTAESQADRIANILDAAERCFARTGFHATTINDICSEAGISAGALYVYFNSKEALINGICERERAEFTKSFQALAEAPDMMGAIGALLLHYFRDEPAYRRRMGVEIGIESTRNPRVCEIFGGCDTAIRGQLEALFDHWCDVGRIAPIHPTPALVEAVMVIGDGMFWRRAIHSDFNAEQIVPAALDMIRGLLRPREPAAQDIVGLSSNPEASQARVSGPTHVSEK